MLTVLERIILISYPDDYVPLILEAWARSSQHVNQKFIKSTCFNIFKAYFDSSVVHNVLNTNQGTHQWTFSNSQSNFFNWLIDIPWCIIVIFTNNNFVYIKCPDRFIFIIVAFIKTWICNLLFSIYPYIFILFFMICTWIFSLILRMDTCIFILMFRVGTWILRLLFRIRFIIELFYFYEWFDVNWFHFKNAKQMTGLIVIFQIKLEWWHTKGTFFIFRLFESTHPS